MYKGRPYQVLASRRIVTT